ncbi:hypothetical protein DP939_06100 [Spongiactinospora rosea]|uniref:Carbohydrate ABC transporter substrate-binding protein (CUT1 family) n=1 Tax=Spongiactinospora rosea TaxID=2248750 RepID=A0A366M382_9ACTN|nr:ABC transporter substrate-binding protein [Spongiactinospora rosea]RBQ20656.1 hypothetical protein DP939_06100 [Spongiactinospora rosea]
MLITRPGRRVFATLLLTAALTACTPGTERVASSAREVEIILPNFPQLITSVERTLDRGFTDRTGIKVRLIKVGDTSYTGVDQRVQNDLIAGRVPDLVITGLNSLRTYADAKRATPLDPLISGDRSFDLADFYPRLLDLGRFDGTVYGIPYGVSTYTLYYNADVFRKAGLDPGEPPRTFSELREAAAAIKSSRSAPNGVVIRSDHIGSYGFQNFLGSGGGGFMNPEETQVAFNSSAGASIVTFWADLRRRGHGRTLPNQQAGDAFTRGDAGMVLQSSSYSATLRAQVTFDVRSAPFPIPDGGTRRAVAGGAAIASFTADRARLQDQWTVIKELVGPRGVTNLVNASGFAPINKKAATDPRYLGGYLERNPLAKPAWDQMAHLVPWYQFPGTHNVEIAKSMTDQINGAIAGDRTPRAALDEAAATVSELIK